MGQHFKYVKRDLEKVKLHFCELYDTASDRGVNFGVLTIVQSTFEEEEKYALIFVSSFGFLYSSLLEIASHKNSFSIHGFLVMH